MHPLERLMIHQRNVMPAAVPMRSWRLPAPIRANQYNAPSLPSPLAWYRADDLALADGADVTTWPDASGNGYDLTPDGATPPTLQTNEQNSLPGVRVVNGTSIMSHLGFTPTVTSDNWTIVVAFKDVSNNGVDYSFASAESWVYAGDGAGPIYALKQGGNVAAQASVFETGPGVVTAYAEDGAPGGAASWMLAQRTVDQVAVSLDGGTEVTGPSLDGVTPTDFVPSVIDAFTVGLAGPTSSEYLVFEVVFYNVRLSAAQKALIPGLLSRWGL